MCGHGQHVVTGSWDKTLILWDIEHAEMVRMYDGHTEGKLLHLAMSLLFSRLIWGWLMLNDKG